MRPNKQSTLLCQGRLLAEKVVWKVCSPGLFFFEVADLKFSDFTKISLCKTTAFDGLGGFGSYQEARGGGVGSLDFSTNVLVYQWPTVLRSSVELLRGVFFMGEKIAHLYNHTLHQMISLNPPYLKGPLAI